MGWTSSEIPDQTGRRFIVTGANSGIGEAAARALAASGASVVLACRSLEKGEQAAARMAGDVTVRVLDLASLASVRGFAESVGTADVLINNAGVMAVPKSRTVDGFECQFGTNYLGHFALTGLLLPRLTSRVVTLSSGAHRTGRIDLADLNWQHRRYRRWPAYAQSKLADLMFAIDLQRRLEVHGSPVISVAAHPGYAATNLQFHTETFEDRIMALLNRVVAQDADAGALPTLYAATMPDVQGGQYYGPGGRGEMRGSPRLVECSKAARDPAVAAQLWTKSEELTGVSFF